MWAEIAAFLKANASETLLISIIGTILVWMYKQFKDMIDRKQQSKLAIAQLKQGLFTRLELSISSVLNLDNEASKQQMYTLLGECGSYLSSTQRSIVRDYYKHFNPQYLHTLLVLIVNEVDKLSQQLDKIRGKEENSEWFNYIMRLYAPFGPILLFAIITLYAVFISQLVKQGATLWIQICSLLFGVTLFLSVSIFIVMIFLFGKREMGKQGVKRWCFVAVIIFSPVLAFVVNLVYMPIVVLCIQILGFIMMERSKRPLEIVSP